jgi:hypothetical protein
MWHVWGGRETHSGFLYVKVRDKDHLEELGVEGKIILELMLKKSSGWAWTEFIWLRIGTSVYGNETSGSIKSGQINSLKTKRVCFI